MEPTTDKFEHFVDAAKAAEFLSLSRKHVLRLSLLGVIPAHPLGLGTRKTWRYLLSELRAYVLAQGTSDVATNGDCPQTKPRGTRSRSR
jgi:hypothetical protein